MKRLLNIITLLFLIVLLNLPSIGHTAGTICAEWGRFAHCSICFPDTNCGGAAGSYWYCMTWTDYYSDGSSRTCGVPGAIIVGLMAVKSL